MMMFYLVCAVVGGTIFICQFVMLLVGFGGEGLDFDGDIPDADRRHYIAALDALGFDYEGDDEEEEDEE